MNEDLSDTFSKTKLQNNTEKIQEHIPFCDTSQSNVAIWHALSSYRAFQNIYFIFMQPSSFCLHYHKSQSAKM